jgi:hypothetical protein
VVLKGSRTDFDFRFLPLFLAPDPFPGSPGGPADARPDRPGRVGARRAGPTAGGPAGPDRESRGGDSNRFQAPLSPPEVGTFDRPRSFKIRRVAELLLRPPRSSQRIAGAVRSEGYSWVCQQVRKWPERTSGNAGSGCSVSSLTTRFRIDCSVLKQLRDEVIEFWSSRNMTLTGSLFRE